MSVFSIEDFIATLVMSSFIIIIFYAIFKLLRDNKISKIKNEELEKERTLVLQEGLDKIVEQLKEIEKKIN